MQLSIINPHTFERRSMTIDLWTCIKQTSERSGSQPGDYIFIGCLQWCTKLKQKNAPSPFISQFKTCVDLCTNTHPSDFLFPVVWQTSWDHSNAPTIYRIRAWRKNPSPRLFRHPREIVRQHNYSIVDKPLSRLQRIFF